MEKEEKNKEREGLLDGFDNAVANNHAHTDCEQYFIGIAQGMNDIIGLEAIGELLALGLIINNSKFKEEHKELLIRMHEATQKND